MHIGFALSGFKNEEEWTSKAVLYNFSDLKARVFAWFNAMRLASTIEERSDNNSALSYWIGETQVGKLEVIEPKKTKIFDLLYPIYFAEFDLSLVEEAAEKLSEFKASSVPKYPSFEFDLAVVVDKSVQVGEMTPVLIKACGRLLSNYHVFDIFEGGSLPNGKKSVGYRLTFLDSAKTLSINDVDPLIKKALKQLKQNFEAELRS